MDNIIQRATKLLTLTVIALVPVILSLLLVLIVLALAGCGNARELDCLDGCSSEKVREIVTQVEVQPELGAVNQLNLVAGRAYSPSQFFNSAVVLPAGRFVLPTQLLLQRGAAGTGWASINIGGLLVCYQGNGANSSQAGNAFLQRGTRVDGKQCFESGLTANTSALAVDTTGESLLTYSINGGGLSSHLQAQGTTALAVISAQQYSY
jgi:hypothetical protein